MSAVVGSVVIPGETLGDVATDNKKIVLGNGLRFVKIQKEFKSILTKLFLF